MNKTILAQPKLSSESIVVKKETPGLFTPGAKEYSHCSFLFRKVVLSFQALAAGVREASYLSNNGVELEAAALKNGK